MATIIIVHMLTTWNEFGELPKPCIDILLGFDNK